MMKITSLMGTVGKGGRGESMTGYGALKGTCCTLQTPGVLILTFPKAGTQDRFNLPM